MKNLFLFFFALFTIAASAQNITQPSYSSVSLPLPFSTLATATATNLSGGWTNTTTTTNSYITYDPVGAAFTTNTVISTNNIVTYADFNAQGQKNVGLQFQATASGSTGSDAYTVWIAKSVNGVTFDNCTQLPVSMTMQGTTSICALTNINMDGFGYGRIVTVSNGTARTVTNNGAFASIYKFRN